MSTLPCVYLCPNKCALLLSMTLFNSSHFLCWSMPSFGVSTTSPKNSLSFNMSPPKSAIIFIKCRNRHHIKNSIRYKGNINNTSVIIFLIGGQILPVILLCLGETPVRFLLLLVVVVHSFLFSLFAVVLHVVVFFICRCSSFTFAFWHHPSRLSVDYRRVFTPILYFQPSPSQALFTLRFFTDILPAIIKASLWAGRSSLKFAGLHTDPRNTDPIHLFV